ncbi:hypothetical protein J6590_033446 [Homalodisca vitripennis]|nr:hypothetical protein J6590_033446 [Homalodisca vitripennis]
MTSTVKGSQFKNNFDLALSYRTALLDASQYIKYHIAAEIAYDCPNLEETVVKALRTHALCYKSITPIIAGSLMTLPFGDSRWLVNVRHTNLGVSGLDSSTGGVVEAELRTVQWLVSAEPWVVSVVIVHHGDRATMLT